MKKTWTREQFSPDGDDAFPDEILKCLDEAVDLDAKRMVLEKAMHAIRSRTFADAVLLTEEIDDVPAKMTKDLLRLSAMFCTDGPWKKFSELVYTPYISECLKTVVSKLPPE